jgi:hypothetical protein
MGVVNLAVGASFCALCWAARSKPMPAATRAPEAAAAKPTAFTSFAVVALLLGFAMMALQTVLIRVGGLALGASHFAFAMLVATFVLCIAIGRLAVSTLRSIPPWVVAACPIAMALLLTAIYPAVEYAPYGAHVLRSLFQSIDQAFYPYFFSASFAILVVFALPLGLSGASLPLIFTPCGTRWVISARSRGGSTAGTPSAA